MRLAQIESEERKMQAELKIRLSKDEEVKNRKQADSNKIKIREASSQLPAFAEDDVDSYFKTFERIAEQNEWAETKWLAILVPKLLGKAYKFYAAIDSDSDYELVKTSILRAYSVTPDSYRQKFRSLKKGFDQTFTEFA